MSGAFAPLRAGMCALALAAGLVAPARAEVLRLTPDEALMTARAAYLAGDVAVAGHIARALVAAEPENTLAHLLLAATEPQLGRAEAGLHAGRRAWRLADTGPDARPLRYEIARNTARAAVQAGHPMQAQFWLRRSLDVAPDAAAFSASGRDLGAVRAANPLRLSFDLEAGPSDNLNGGASSGVFRIGDFVLGDLSNGAQAVSGFRASARMRAERALPGSDRAQTVLTFGAEAVRNKIDAASRKKAGKMTSRDLDRAQLAFGLRRDMRLGEKGLPLSLSVEVAQTWAGGPVMGPSLTLAAQGAVWQDAQQALWLGATVERAWDAANPSGADLIGLSLVGERSFGATRASVALAVETAQSDHVNTTFDAARLSVQVQPAWQIAGASVTMGVNAGWRDYDAFNLIGGVVAVTGGRQDRSIGLSMDLELKGLSVMGYAPVLSLRHGQTRSNVSRYETTTSGISLGISSVF